MRSTRHRLLAALLAGALLAGAAVSAVGQEYRTEHDLLGEKQIPADAYYGVQTARALEKQISGLSAARGNQAPRRFFFQLWHRPPMTFGGDSLVTHALDRCAAENVFGHVPRPSFTPEPEALKTAIVDIEIIPLDLGDAAPLTAAPVTLRMDAEAIYRPGPGFIDAIGELCDKLRAADIAGPEH